MPSEIHKAFKEGIAINGALTISKPLKVDELERMIKLLIAMNEIPALRRDRSLKK